MPNPKSRRQTLKSFTAILGGFTLFSPTTKQAFAQKPPVYTSRNADHALSGYDAVAYLKYAKAVKGAEDISMKYRGATWFFSSHSNMDDFSANPESYAPQFGGYCAYSVAKGELIKGDPELWAIEDDKLYVNYNKGAHKLWLHRSADMIETAVGNLSLIHI